MVVSKYDFFLFFLLLKEKKKVNGKTSRYFLSDCNLQTRNRKNGVEKNSKKETQHLFLTGNWDLMLPIILF